MSTLQISSVIADVLSEVCDCDASQLAPSTVIKDDLGIDSVTFLLALLQLQQRLQLDFTAANGDIAQVRTVAELVELCGSLQAKGIQP